MHMERPILIKPGLKFIYIYLCLIKLILKKVLSSSMPESHFKLDTDVDKMRTMKMQQGILYIYVHCYTSCECPFSIKHLRRSKDQLLTSPPYKIPAKTNKSSIGYIPQVERLCFVAPHTYR